MQACFSLDPPPPCAQPQTHSRAVSGCWPLYSGRAVSLKPREPALLRIAHGRVWLTAGASSEDRVLGAGDMLAVEAGTHVVMEPWSPHADDMPVLFLWERVAPQHRFASTRAGRDWEAGVVQPLRDLRGALAGAGRAVGAAVADVATAGGRLGAGLARFALGRGAVPAAADGRIYIKNGCNACG